MTKKEAHKKLSKLFNKHDIDPNRPIVLAVSRYDVHKNQKGIIIRIIKSAQIRVTERFGDFNIFLNPLYKGVKI